MQHNMRATTGGPNTLPNINTNPEEGKSYIWNRKSSQINQKSSQRPNMLKNKKIYNDIFPKRITEAQKNGRASITLTENSRSFWNSYRKLSLSQGVIYIEVEQMILISFQSFLNLSAPAPVGYECSLSHISLTSCQPWLLV